MTRPLLALVFALPLAASAAPLRVAPVTALAAGRAPRFTRAAAAEGMDALAEHRFRQARNELILNAGRRTREFLAAGGGALLTHARPPMPYAARAEASIFPADDYGSMEEHIIGPAGMSHERRAHFHVDAEAAASVRKLAEGAARVYRLGNVLATERPELFWFGRR